MAKKQRPSNTAASLSSSSSSAAPASKAAIRHHGDDQLSQSMSLPDEFLPSSSSPITTPPLTLIDWIHHERQSLLWILGCAALGALLGFGVGAGWFTRGYGSWHFVMKDPSAPDSEGRVKQEFVRQFIITPWRLAMARRMRSTLIYEMITLKKAPWAIFEYLTTTNDVMGGGGNNINNTPGDDGWIASSCMWPPNWILFRQLDLSNIEVGEGGLSSPMMTFLSLVLPWRRNLIKALGRKEKRVTLHDADGNVVDDSHIYQGTTPTSFASRIKGLLIGSSSSSGKKNAPVDAEIHPFGFYALREYIVRYDHGYVHPDLGFLVPAPSGAARGIGMIRDSFNKCQRHCFPGTAEERGDKEKVELIRLQELKEQQRAEQEIMDEMKRQFPELSSDTAGGGRGGSQPPRPASSSSSTQHKAAATSRNTTTYEGIQADLHHQATSATKPYSQHELLLHIPLEAQITRSTAFEILKNVIPEEVMKNQIAALDDAFVLTILLAHERGLGDGSRFWPYIVTLSPSPTCALNPNFRQSVVDVVTALSVEMGTDVVGWPNEIGKAAEVAERIVSNLSMQYKSYIATPPGINLVDMLRWALCHVASRAVAGKESHGRLRLVPMMDLINHDEAADKFHEVVGNETSDDLDGFAIHAEESDAGAFVVRSRRHGRSKPLKKGQELMANYNVPNYSPLDWFINMGFVPPERTGKWAMLEAGLPPSYRGGFSRKSTTGVTGVGAFGSGQPNIQVIRQHTTQSASQQHQSPQVLQSQQQQAQQQQTCQG